MRQKCRVASVALPTINPTRSPTALEGPDPGLNGMKLATNRLSYDTANTAVRAQITCPNQMLVSGYHERNLHSFSKHPAHITATNESWHMLVQQIDAGWVVEESGYDTRQGKRSFSPKLLGLVWGPYSILHIGKQGHFLDQCFSTAGPRPDTGPWHQLYRAARHSPGIDN